MSDEQVIYISPEDDLTTIRERLEQIPARQITLVIPRQTQLRSHVSWRNLYGRAHELDKDILIVSADAQIRSVAQAAKFRVAHSLESAPAVRSRATSRTSRTTSSTGRRTTSSSQLRPSSTRSGIQQRRPGTPDSPNGQRRPASGQMPPRSAPAKGPYPLENSSTGMNSEELIQFDDEPTQSEVQRTQATTYRDVDRYTPTRNQPLARSYDFRDTAPPVIMPLSPQQIEEPDLLLEDVRQAQDIRQAALQNREAPSTPAARDTQNVVDASMHEGAHDFRGYRIAAPPNEPEDPFVFMEDFSRPALAEQHGSVSLDYLDGDAPPRVESSIEYSRTTPHSEIEYQSDGGDFVIHADTPPRSWDDPIAEAEVDSALPQRSQALRRSRVNRAPREPVAPPTSPEVENLLPPIEDVPTQGLQPPAPVVPLPAEPVRPRASQPIAQKPRSSRDLGAPAASTRRSSQELTADPQRIVPARRASQPMNQRPSRPIGQQPAQSVSQRPSQPIKQRPSQPIDQRAASRTAIASGTRMQPSRTTPRPPVSRRRSSSRAIIPISILVLAMLLLGALAYFGPTADVTISLASRPFSAPIQFSASPQGHAEGAYPAVLLTRHFTKTGTGRATGSVKIGTAKATGNVIFTNTGTIPVDIPTGIIVTTSSGVQFATTADAVANTANSAPGNTVQIPVQAALPGEGGNVPTGSITTIPSDSLAAIAKNNGSLNASALKLQVNNTDPTTGGGVGNATAVSSSDIESERAALRTQLNTDINTWLQGQLGSGDIAGDPTKTEAVISGPTVNQVADNGTFDMTLAIDLKVPVVRNAVVQQAAAAQLNQALSKDTSANGYTIVTDAPITLSGVKTTAETTATGLTVNATAAGRAAVDIDKQQVRQRIAGRTIGDAQAQLKNISGVENADIKVSPAFFPFVPWWGPHITIKTLAV